MITVKVSDYLSLIVIMLMMIIILSWF